MSLRRHRSAARSAADPLGPASRNRRGAGRGPCDGQRQDPCHTRKGAVPRSTFSPPGRTPSVSRPLSIAAPHYIGHTLQPRASHRALAHGILVRHNHRIDAGAPPATDVQQPFAGSERVRQGMARRYQAGLCRRRQLPRRRDQAASGQIRGLLQKHPASCATDAASPKAASRRPPLPPPAAAGGGQPSPTK